MLLLPARHRLAAEEPWVEEEVHLEVLTKGKKSCLHYDEDFGSQHNFNTSLWSFRGGAFGGGG